MGRGDSVMKWIRLWCERLTSPDSQTWRELGAAWELYTKLMCLAGISERQGKIVLPGTDCGYTPTQLADRCRMPPERLTAQLDTLIVNGKVKQLPNDVLEMTDWSSFQTAYDKQLNKGYRQRLHLKVTPEGYDTEEQKNRRTEETDDKKNLSVSSESELTKIVEFWNLSEAGVRCRDANATVVAALRRKVEAHGYARVLEAIDTYRIVRTARAADVHGVEQKLCPLGAGSYRWSLLQFCQRGNVEEDFFAGDRETAIRNRIGKGFPTGTVARFAVPFVVPPEFVLPGRTK